LLVRSPLSGTVDQVLGYIRVGRHRVLRAVALNAVDDSLQRLPTFARLVLQWIAGILCKQLVAIGLSSQERLPVE
jgi:hypothetical protein